MPVTNVGVAHLGILRAPAAQISFTDGADLILEDEGLEAASKIPMTHDTHMWVLAVGLAKVERLPSAPGPGAGAFRPDLLGGGYELWGVSRAPGAAG
jgi:hypothetical protein